jgi:uncharacterized protein YprB with RNaseH-like and TPR domain
MADIKDKLEQLKKERKARSRSKSQLVKDTWEQIEKKANLSVKDKLEHLISLTREEKPQKLKAPPFEPLKREPLQFIENPYPLDVKYGKVTLSSGLEIKGSILIDLETTGLSGGSGVVAFLVGLGFYRDDKFYVAQFFLGELAEEEKMIQELGQFFSQMNFQSIVTFNGKGFDMPLLETRFILHKQPFILSELPHLDFLFPARSLWRHKHENCRLYHLAREVVEADRSEDIPSAEIPWRYFEYLNTGNFELIEPILYHNQEDILSLLGVIIVGSFFFSDEKKDKFTDAMDLFGAGRVMENVGEAEKSVHFFKRALEEGLSDELSLTAKKKISYHFKKNQEWKSAVSLWKEMTSSNARSRDLLCSFRELAMYLEHKEKKYEEARKIAEEGYVLSLDFSSYFEKDFTHRRERLKRKIQKQKEKKK